MNSRIIRVLIDITGHILIMIHVIIISTLLLTLTQIKLADLL